MASLKKQGGWLGRLGDGAWAPGVGDTGLRLRFPAGVRVLVARAETVEERLGLAGLAKTGREARLGNGGLLG